MKVKSLSRVRLFTTPWSAAYQAPLSTGFSRQEYWRGAIAFSNCLPRHPEEVAEILLALVRKFGNIAYYPINTRRTTVTPPT